MLENQLLDAALIQLKRTIPDNQAIQVAQARALLSSTNCLPTKTAFATRPQSAAISNPWVVQLGHFQLGFDVPTAQFIQTDSSHCYTAEARPHSLNLQKLAEAPELPSSTLQEATDFLASAFGIHPTGTSRPYPSAGGLYQVQVFVLVRTNDGWIQGHFLPLTGQLEILGTITTKQVHELLGVPYSLSIEKLHFIIGYGVLPTLAIPKYGPRGYKFALIEIGLMTQSATTSATQLHYRCVPFGGFDEASAARAWNLNPTDCWIELLQFFRLEETPS